MSYLSEEIDPEQADFVKGKDIREQIVTVPTPDYGEGQGI